ncbi:MAG: HD domain-containing protein [Desulfuromonadaceae bacterium]|nr:HD domain-containing protein [Desulfuromonadaceae bacterium]MDD5105676.1 HD domain-containing protein [Desulfuromonadaceae bacterium]
MHLEKAVEEMKLVFKSISYGIEHTTRVLSNAEFILNGESITGTTWEIVSLAAVLHDIGAIEAQKKHGSMEGHFQEIEGPPIAQSILERIGVPAATANRVCYIVGNHHTPAKIDGIDFQIIWEADYLEYLQFGEKEKGLDTLRQKIAENFKTITGRNLAYERLGISAMIFTGC